MLKINIKNMLQEKVKIINQKTIIVKSTIIVLVSLFLFANKVFADWEMPSTAPANVPTDFETSILNLTNWILGFVAMIAILAVIWGGVMYIGSAGDETKATTGKRVVSYALIGLVIAGIAYALVDVIVTTILV